MSASAKPSDPRAMSSSAASSSGLTPRRSTMRPANQKPAIMPTGKVATSSPIVAGPAPVASAIPGVTGTITL